MHAAYFFQRKIGTVLRNLFAKKKERTKKKERKESLLAKDRISLFARSKVSTEERKRTIMGWEFSLGMYEDANSRVSEGVVTSIERTDDTFGGPFAACV